MYIFYSIFITLIFFSYVPTAQAQINVVEAVLTNNIVNSEPDNVFIRPVTCSSSSVHDNSATINSNSFDQIFFWNKINTDEDTSIDHKW